VSLLQGLTALHSVLEVFTDGSATDSDYFVILLTSLFDAHLFSVLHDAMQL